MSLNLNRVTIAGNLTRDPELKAAGSSQVCSFGVACNRQWKDKDGTKKEEVTFVEVVAWGKSAEFVSNYFKKGEPVYVEGRLTQEAWEDKKDGTKRSKTRVTAENIQFVSGKRDRTEAEPAPLRAAPVRPAAATADDDDSQPPF